MQDRANELTKHGADKIYLIDNPALERFQPEAYLSIIHSFARAANYQLESMLIGSTREGRPLAARLATRLDTRWVPECARLSVDDNKRLIGERITYGGNAIAQVTSKSKSQIAPVPARAFERPEEKDQCEQITKLNLKVKHPKTEVLERKPPENFARACKPGYHDSFSAVLIGAR